MIVNKIEFKKLEESLERLGLSSGEASLYLASVELGPASIGALAFKTKIQRPNIYKLINSLAARGLSEPREEGGRGKNFMVSSPAKIKELLKNKIKEFSGLENEVSGIMPALLAAWSQGSSVTKIKLLESKEEWMDVFFETLEEAAGEIQWFGNYEEWLSFVSEKEEKRWIEKRIARKVGIKLLFPPGKRAEALSLGKSAPEIREVRILKTENQYPCSFQLYNKKMIIWQPRSPLSLLIEDEYMVQMFRSIFFSLWDAAPLLKS